MSGLEERWWWRDPKDVPPFDWNKFWQGMGRTLEFVFELHRQAQEEAAAKARKRVESRPEPDDVTEARAAAALLGVALDASIDEIRAALRRKLGASGLHPDHGGDGEQAKRLIAAKNLLVERARQPGYAAGGRACA